MLRGMCLRLMGRRSRGVRDLADHRRDLGDYKFRRGVLHHVTDIAQHDQFRVRYRLGEWP